MKILSTFAAASVAVSLVATPVAAAELPVSSQRSAYTEGTFQFEEDNGEYRRRYRRYRRNRVDAGDVIAGIAILGGIAAIASAASKNKRRDRYDDRRYNNRYNQRSYNSSNLDRAVNSCMREIERNVRVESVDNVGRSGNGWQVSGRLYDGNGFTCSVGQNGRIDNIQYGQQGSGYSGAAADDRQWSDDAYAQARNNAGVIEPRPAVPTTPTGPQPAYPGGPVDGDLGG
ncbi:hypothetical protein [Parerythrobacter jejuensis]|uniref:Secreted protein n=1 Tax=Parerythrobacter jejuensis TaxID=795812 RepID=A0A845AQY7_9SPHN|nr:hypothetical protein [Parerythrobacter jejuensis]MXP32720.1 hypothetical protein [Parerythrobacter jejuensis]